MSTDLFDFNTENEHLRTLNDGFLVNVERFESMSLPVNDTEIAEIESIMMEATAIMVKAENDLDFAVHEQHIFNLKELLLSMQKVFSRLLRVVNDSVNVGIIRKTPQKEFDDFLKDQKKRAKYYRKVRDNMRNLKLTK